ncbi:MAG: SIMPL domain-containing protein [Clostridia bacterium]|nr:SIMPL domain-containing protein [Clostridia bacterium]
MKMKKLIALTLALLLMSCAALAETAFPAADSATLTVTGNATVTLPADYAQASVGVSTRAATVQEATAQNAEAIRSVITALVAAGIPESDIATSSYSVYAEYDYQTGEAVPIGFSVSNQLTVIIRDMDHIGATLDKATAAGANSIHSVQFCSTLSASAQDEAMTLAVQDALRKGQLLAGAAGLTVGSVLSITESTGGHYTTPVMYKTAGMADAVSNVILPDDLSISASVTITFELK